MMYLIKYILECYGSLIFCRLTAKFLLIKIRYLTNVGFEIFTTYVVWTIILKTCILFTFISELIKLI